MRLELKVIPGAKKNLFQEESPVCKVYLTAPPVDGRANRALINFLAEHFNVPRTHVQITKGLKSRYKTIIISAN